MCSNCKLKNHNKCNYIHKNLYERFKLYPDLFQCLKCKVGNILFRRLNDYEFVQNGEIKIGNNKKTSITPNKYQQDMFERISKEILEYNTVLSK